MEEQRRFCETHQLAVVDYERFYFLGDPVQIGIRPECNEDPERIIVPGDGSILHPIFGIDLKAKGDYVVELEGRVLWDVFQNAGYRDVTLVVDPDDLTDWVNIAKKGFGH